MLRYHLSLFKGNASVPECVAGSAEPRKQLCTSRDQESFTNHPRFASGSLTKIHEPRSSCQFYLCPLVWRLPQTLSQHEASSCFVPRRSSSTSRQRGPTPQDPALGAGVEDSSSTLSPGESGCRGARRARRKTTHKLLRFKRNSFSHVFRDSIQRRPPRPWKRGASPARSPRYRHGPDRVRLGPHPDSGVQMVVKPSLIHCPSPRQIHIYIYIYAHMCVCIYIYIYIYMYTYI